MRTMTPRMSTNVKFGTRRRFGWALQGAIARMLGLAAAPAAAQAPESLVTNRASATYRTGPGTEGGASAEATVRVERSAGVRLAPSRTVVVRAGENRVFAHTLINTGATRQRFELAATAPNGWHVTLYLDRDGSGAPDPANALTEPVELGGASGIGILAVVRIPSDARADERVDLTVTARGVTDPSLTAVVRNTLVVEALPARLAFWKTVDRQVATVGDTLAYSLHFRNGGEGVADGAEIVDVLPAGLAPVPGSIRVTGAAAAFGTPAFEALADGRARLVVRAAAVEPAEGGSVDFRVVVQSADTEIENVATLTAPGGDPIVASATTGLSMPDLALVKILGGGGSIRVGEEIRYGISWSNRSPSASAYGVVLVDTLPVGMEFVSASVKPHVEGRVLRWEIGTLAVGQQGSLTLVTRATVEMEGEIVNRAVLKGANSPAVAAAAGAFRLAGAAAARLEIDKRAGVLEAGLGDAIPYRITLRNRGEASLSGLSVHDLLPEGLAVSAASVEGADSTDVAGRSLRVWISGPLGPGQEATVRYIATLVSTPSGGMIENRATAEAEGGLVRSDTASALVRIRGGVAVQSRAVIGRVWVDANGNGRLDSVERGVPGVEIWSEDGEVVVTDGEGRYSFRDLRPGTHTLRLDARSLPSGHSLYRTSEQMIRVQVNGWTTPRADFRVQAAAAAVGVPAPAAVLASAALLAPAMEPEVEAAPARPTVKPLRSAEDRQSEAARAFLEGPPVRIVSPTDGEVLSSNRLYVGVQGEAGMGVRVYLGEELLSEATLRPDGRMDFVGIELPEGPSRLRIAMLNSWGNEKEDSIVVHRAGAPAAVALDRPAEALRVDEPAFEAVRVTVLDAWGVPVPEAVVTLDVDGARLEMIDVDRSSVGIQVKAPVDGVIPVSLRTSGPVGPAELRVSSGRLIDRVPLRVLPSTRPLIATGSAQIGFGAAPEAFGAVTMRGAIGQETSVTVSYDSRRGDPEQDFFGRGYDPLEDGRYPTFGDASERRVLSGTTQKLSARVEHGYDWLEVGDVQTGDFAGGGRLASYQRSVTGVGARLGTGPLGWRAFGSVTDQVVSQLQARGDGTSGPYRLGAGMRPGTERVAIELRAADNAVVILAREELHRFVDYQIDYVTGEIMLQRPVPAADAGGNPLFVVATVERRSGDDARFVGGLRMEFDAGRLLGLQPADSLGLFVLGVHDAGEAGGGTFGQDLLGGGLRFARSGIHGGGELLRSVAGESAAHAGRASLGWATRDQRARLGAEWTHVGSGFVQDSDPRLSAAVQELRVSGDVRIVDATRLRLTHGLQRFEGYGVERTSTSLQLEQRAFGQAVTAEAGLSTDLSTTELASRSSTTALAKVRVPVSPDLALWIEGTQPLSNDLVGPAGIRPAQLAIGSSYRITRRVQLEAAQRWVGVPGDSAAQGVTSMKLKMQAPLGGQLWGGVDRFGFDNASSSALLGWSPSFRIRGGWSADGMFERRFGLDRAPLLDPVRALPFAQTEANRWSTGGGVRWLPADSAGRFTAHAERHGGDRRAHRVEIGGEAPMGTAAAVLTRHDWWGEERQTAQGRDRSRRDRSLVGIAFRPATLHAVHVLGKVEWRRDVNPGMGARFSGGGEERRLIGAVDAIWSPWSGGEVGGRYAARATLSGDALLGPQGTPVQGVAHFLGGRADQTLLGPLAVRIDSRFLVDGTGTSRWSAAPAGVLRLGGRIEVEGGYRFGDLQDSDFARGGQGLYATIGIQVTESVLGSAAAFWRERMAADR
jgi:uncharacterized repeat protein (TIGR01451 family)